MKRIILLIMLLACLPSSEISTVNVDKCFNDISVQDNKLPVSINYPVSDNASGIHNITIFNGNQIVYEKSFNQLTRIFTINFQISGQDGNYNYLLTVFDNVGNTASCSFSVNIYHVSSQILVTSAPTSNNNNFFPDMIFIGIIFGLGVLSIFIFKKYH